jgi:hypothetical protein
LHLPVKAAHRGLRPHEVEHHDQHYHPSTSAPAGVDVHIQTPGDGLSGWCTYSSFVRGNPFGKPLPAINVPFYLGPVGEVNEAQLWFPAWPTGSTWDTTVSCPNGTMTVPSVW